MNNRIVTLSVVEDLIHWPLQPRRGCLPPKQKDAVASALLLADDADDERGGGGYLTAGAAEDYNEEPPQRRTARCRAVLLLPLLAAKLKQDWTQQEILLYLLRCAEEEDGQLLFCAALSLLGLVYPHPATEDIYASSAGAAAASGKSKSEGSNPLKKRKVDNNYLSLEEVLPLLEALSQTREVKIRDFLSEVIIPHLFFGTSLPKPALVNRYWEQVYLPAKGGARSSAAAAASSSGSGGGIHSSTSNSETLPGWRTASEEGEEWSGVHYALLLALKDGRDGNRNDNNNHNKNNNNNNNNNMKDKKKSIPSAAAAMKENGSRSEIYQGVLLRESMSFLLDHTQANLCAPFHQLYYEATVSDGNGKEDGGKEEESYYSAYQHVTGIQPTSRSDINHFQLNPAIASHHDAVNEKELLLCGAPFYVYGANYAVPSLSAFGSEYTVHHPRQQHPHAAAGRGHTYGRSGADGQGARARRLGALSRDYFAMNVKAATVREDILAWMRALTAAAAGTGTPTPTPTEEGSEYSESVERERRKDSSVLTAANENEEDRSSEVLCVRDYIDEKHDFALAIALRRRWQHLLLFLELLFSGKVVNSVVVAVLEVSNLLSTLLFFERRLGQLIAVQKQRHSAQQTQQQQQQQPFSLVNLELLRPPSQPLQSSAELDFYVLNCMRTHVAMCALIGSSFGSSSASSSIKRRFAHMLRDEATMRTHLQSARQTLRSLLYKYRIFSPVGGAPSPTAATGATAEHGRTRSSSLLAEGDAGFHHTRLFAFEANAAAPTSSKGKGAGLTLALGPGPVPLYQESHLLWDVAGLMDGGGGAPPPPQQQQEPRGSLSGSTTPESTAATPTAAGGGAAAGRVVPALHLPPSEGAAGSHLYVLTARCLRLHRLLRIAIVQSLPNVLDMPSYFYPPAAATTSSSSSTTTTTTATTAATGAQKSITVEHAFSWLVQLCVPPGMLRPECLPTSAYPFSTTTASTNQNSKSKLQQKQQEEEEEEEEDGSLWTSPAALLGECAASADFALYEAILNTLHQLFSSIAYYMHEEQHHLQQQPKEEKERAATTATKMDVAQLQQRIAFLCASCCTLYQVIISYSTRYAAWKARWLLAMRLPSLTAALQLVWLRAIIWENALRVYAASSSSSVLSDGLVVRRGVAALFRRVLVFLYTEWAPQQNKFLPLSGDEEVEVRAVAASGLVATLAVVVHAALRLHVLALAALTDPTASTSSHTTKKKSDGLPLVLRTGSSHEAHALLCLESLVGGHRFRQLRVAILENVKLCGKDAVPKVRCGAVGALALLARTLSTLADAVTSAAQPSSTSSSKSAATTAATPPADAWGVQEATELLFARMTDSSSLVRLTLVSEMGDLLKSDAALQVSAAAGGAGNNNNNNSIHNTNEVLLLNCLQQLARHEIWRFRVTYVHLLSSMIYNFLSSSATFADVDHHHHTGAGDDLATDTSLSTPPPQPTPPNSSRSLPRYQTSKPHEQQQRNQYRQQDTAQASKEEQIQRLHRFARNELLPLLVQTLFDKVRAVRDAALDCAVELCSALERSRFHPTGGRRLASALGAAGDGGSGERRGGSQSAPRRAEDEEEEEEEDPLDADDEDDEDEGDGSGTRRRGRRGHAYGESFTNDVLWPLVQGSPLAWDTYLSRSALLRVALRLPFLKKKSVLMPLLDKLAHDTVLNVRMVVAKAIRASLLQSASHASDAHAATSMSASTSAKPIDAEAKQYAVLMGLQEDDGHASSRASRVGCLKETFLVFSQEEKDGVVLRLLRQLLEDTSSDVRDEAAKALQVCF